MRMNNGSSIVRHEDGSSTVHVVNPDGRSYSSTHFSAEFDDRFYAAMSQMFNDGVARFGSAEAYGRALEACNEIRDARRAGLVSQ